MAIWLAQDGRVSEANAETIGNGDPGVDWILVRASCSNAALDVANAYDRRDEPRWNPDDGPYTGAHGGVWNIWRWVEICGGEADWIGWEATLEEALEAARRNGGHRVQYGTAGEVYWI